VAQRLRRRFHSQAEDELSALLLQARAHVMHVRAAYNPPDFTIDPAMLNPWANPATSDAEAIKYVLATAPCSARLRRCTSRSPNCAISASVTLMPDRIRRHEPRTKPRLDAALRPRGDARIPALIGKGLAHVNLAPQ